MGRPRTKLRVKDLVDGELYAMQPWIHRKNQNSAHCREDIICVLCEKTEGSLRLWNLQKTKDKISYVEKGIMPKSEWLKLYAEAQAFRNGHPTPAECRAHYAKPYLSTVFGTWSDEVLKNVRCIICKWDDLEEVKRKKMEAAAKEQAEEAKQRAQYQAQREMIRERLDNKYQALLVVLGVSGMTVSDIAGPLMEASVKVPESVLDILIERFSR